MADDQRIDALCEATGIALSFTDGDGRTQRATEDAKRHALSALSIAVSNEGEIADSLAQAKLRARRPVPELLPVEAGREPRIHVRGDSAMAWSLVTEAGETHQGRVPAAATALPLPSLPAGYHRLALNADGASPLAATVLAAPPECFLPDALLSGGKAWGATAQVYSLRGARDAGIGTYADVEALAHLIGERGGAFLGLSPVHALFGSDVSKFSPYSPSSRLFLQTGLVAPDAVPGFDAGDLERHDTDGAGLIDYPSVLSRQRRALDAIWTRTKEVAIRNSAGFRAAGGARLEQHATFEALSEHFKAQGLHWLGEWPPVYRNAHAPEVDAFRRDHPERIAFHIWLQWLADTQLAAAAASARSSGMPIGLYRDLAVGADRGGSEVWGAPDSFVATLSVGAPPDPLGPLGQDWGLPPLHPLALATTGCAAFRELVSANMRHAGAIRIDHAFQLERLFVLPVGGTAKDGVYLSYPVEALLACLKIESHRARCVVIGEDLGTAPPGFSERIMEAGMLSYRLLPFERGGGGTFKPPSAYPSRALAALSTHDLPTFTGWWRGLDIDVRECLGVYDPVRAAAERSVRLHDHTALQTAFGAQELALDDTGDRPPDIAAIRYLARTPSMLVAVQLEDVLREHQQANLPGPDCGHPNWRRRSSVVLDKLAERPGIDRVAAAMAQEGRATRNFAPSIPRATYRLQLHPKFTFDDAIVVLPYLTRLGISHVYLSPIQMSAPGSTHGYDVVDPSRIDPELGGRNGFIRLSDAAMAHGLRLLVDIVPNHVGVGGKSNPWWLDVLEWGRESPFAAHFDIDWEKPGADSKLVVPFLGAPLEELLAKRQVGLGFEAARGRFGVWYADHCHPISPLGYGALLAHAKNVDAEAACELATLQRRFATLSGVDPRGRHALAAALKQDLASACTRDPTLRAALERVGDDLPVDALREICDGQAWRLIDWTEANRCINYRRFFDITSLAGVRVEDPDVFEASHAVIFDLVEEGRIHGLRVDHVDGLADPAQYLRRLQARVGPGFFIAVEKILEPGEHLPKWHIAGTTGYDALHTLDAVFFAKASLPSFDAMANSLVGAQDQSSALVAIKGDLLRRTFISEFDALLADVQAAVTSETPDRIAAALRALLAAFPVYRTYGDAAGLSDADRAVLGQVVADASSGLSELDRQALAPVIEALAKGGRALRRFQQLTGPLMAKSFEDTLFYRDTRFIAANEVGCGPAHPGIEAAEFHRANAERLRDWPASMIATATHDTKRGEDARGRLLAASHQPDGWRAAWDIFRRAPDAERIAPTDLYFMFQSLIAACPVELDDAARASFIERAGGMVEKFLREAKLRSTWTAPDKAYEGLVRDFVGTVAGNQGVLFGDLAAFVRSIAIAGARVGIARTVLKCTIPGVPDIYQGTELADLSFVDPDNRRPVDYERRDEALRATFDPGDSRALLAGEGKLAVLRTLLRDRAAHRSTYQADYAPLAVDDDDAAVAFTRGADADQLCVVVSRNFGRVEARDMTTEVSLPAGPWRNLFDGRTLHAGGALKLGEVFGAWPAAVLRRSG